jgi:hypothetical protein
MKVLYISSMRDFFSGAKKQLKWEKESASELGIDWNIVVIHDGIIEDSLIEINPPIFFRNILLRNLFTWIYIIKEQKNNKNKGFQIQSSTFKVELRIRNLFY